MLNAAAFFDRPKTTARAGQRKLDDWYPPLEDGLRANSSFNSANNADRGSTLCASLSLRTLVSPSSVICRYTEADPGWFFKIVLRLLTVSGVRRPAGMVRRTVESSLISSSFNSRATTLTSSPR